jgi:hypothetical protein
MAACTAPWISPETMSGICSNGRCRDADQGVIAGHDDNRNLKAD